MKFTDSKNLLQESSKDKSLIRKFMVSKHPKQQEIKFKIRQNDGKKSVFTRIMELKGVIEERKAGQGDFDMDFDGDDDALKSSKINPGRAIPALRSESAPKMGRNDDYQRDDDGITVLASGFDKDVDSEKLVQLFQTFGVLDLFTMHVNAARLFQGSGIVYFIQFL